MRRHYSAWLHVFEILVKLWPLWLAIFGFLLVIDWAIQLALPVITFWPCSLVIKKSLLWILFLSSSLLAVVKAIYHYWFFLEWLPRAIVELDRHICHSEKQADHFAKRFLLQRFYPWVRGAILWCNRKIEMAESSQRWFARLARWPMKTRWRFPVIFGIGCWPFSSGGVRTCMGILCSVHAQRLDLILLNIGNVIHFALIIWGWDKVIKYYFQ